MLEEGPNTKYYLPPLKPIIEVRVRNLLTAESKNQNVRLVNV
jgi:hypothetical protein